MAAVARVLVAVALARVAAAAVETPPLDWVVKEADVPVHNPETSSWLKGERVAAEQHIDLTAVLRVEEDRRQQLEQTLLGVSDPDSPAYGQHLSVEAITDLLGVPAERVQVVKKYFESWGATVTVAPNRDVLSLKMAAASAERALRTVIHTFRHREAQDITILRAASPYSVPAALAEHVVMVGELLQFPRITQPLSSQAKGQGDWPNACDNSACSGLVTPAVLAQRYKLPKGSDASASGGHGMAVAEFQGQYYEKQDLQSFSQACHVEVSVDRLIGGDRQSPGVESELDIEYIKGVAQDVPLTVIYNNQYSLLAWANQIVSLDDVPYVHSVSYGNDEAQQSGRDYMYSCNTAFMKAGARGLSILFASGDQGVCGREGCGLFKIRFKPDFPAGSPYITAVGGTNFLTDQIGEETAWSASGGGFSDTFPIPDFQKEAVAGYKSSPDADLPSQNYWNNTGRGYPDIAALGGTKTPYCVATGGSFGGVAGTSASCPVAAGVFSRINSLRLAAGKPVMGFLNPFIYKNPKGFQDVTTGRNGAGRPKLGFKAIAGWDPATGFGTPDFEALSQLAMAAVQPQQQAPVDTAIVV